MDEEENKAGKEKEKSASQRSKKKATRPAKVEKKKAGPKTRSSKKETAETTDALTEEALTASEVAQEPEMQAAGTAKKPRGKQKKADDVLVFPEKPISIAESASEREAQPEAREEAKPGLNKKVLLMVANGLIVFGIVAMLIPVTINGYSYYTQWRLKKTWENKVEELTKRARLPKVKKIDLSLPPVPGEELAKQNGIAYLVIPRMALRAVVLKGTNYRDLIKGPGHLRGTSLPGEKGNCVISGHRTMYGAPFGNLDLLSPGADILVYTKDKIYHYVVKEKKIVSPDDLSVVDPTKDNRLTLTTCHPKFSDRNRLVVIALLKEAIK